MSDATILTFYLPPQPDQLLSPKDIDILGDSALRGLLAENRKALDSLDNIWSTLQGTLKLVHARREEYKTRQRLLLDRTTLVNLLPNEVLATIFDYVVLTREWQPVALWKDLTHVCQRWRQIAQRTTQVGEEVAFNLDIQNFDQFPHMLDRLRYRCSIPGEVTLKISFQNGVRPARNLEAVPELLDLLAEQHKAAIYLTLDGNSAIRNILATRNSPFKFPRVARITLRTAGHVIEGAFPIITGDDGIELPILEALRFQSSLVDIPTIQQHRSWVFRPQNVQGIRHLKLDHVTGDALRHLLTNLTRLYTLRVNRLDLSGDQSMTERRREMTYHVAHPTLGRFAIAADPFDTHNFNLSLDCPSLCALAVSNISPSFVTNLHPLELTVLTIYGVHLPPSFTTFLAQFASLTRLHLNGISHEDLVEFTNAFTRPHDPLLPSLYRLIITYRGPAQEYNEKVSNKRLELAKELGRLTSPRTSGASRILAFQLQHLDFVTTQDLSLMFGVLNGWDCDRQTDRVAAFNKDMKEINTYLDEKTLNFETLYEKWTSFTNEYRDIDSPFIMGTSSTRRNAAWDEDCYHNRIWFLIERVTEVLSGTKYAEGPWKAITDGWKKAFRRNCQGKGWMLSLASECALKGGKLAPTGNFNGLYYGERMASLVADSYFRDEELGFSMDLANKQI